MKSTSPKGFRRGFNRVGQQGDVLGEEDFPREFALLVLDQLGFVPTRQSGPKETVHIATGGEEPGRLASGTWQSYPYCASTRCTPVMPPETGR